MCGVSTELPHLTAVNLEVCLASDEVLVHFFNDFLSLPSFTEALYYSRESGHFEFVSAPECVSSRSDLHCRKPKLLTCDWTLLTNTPVENQYSVCQLDREQGIQWIVRERLPFFLQSDCYVEYRLAMLVFQWDSNPCIQRSSSSGQTTLSASQLLCLSQFKKTKNAMCRHSIENKTLEQEKLTGDSHKKFLQEPSSHIAEASELQLKDLASRLSNNVLKNALNVMAGQSQANKSDCLSKDQTNCINKEKSCECKVCQPSVNGGMFKGKTAILQEDKTGNEVEGMMDRDKANRAGGSWVSAQQNVPDSCCRGAGWHDRKPGLDKFKKFLQGTSGEKIINLWMDIEKLKIVQHRERKNRYLVLMRSRYLLSSSRSSLHAELLSRLGLSTPPCWTEEKLHSVQPVLTEALLSYWAPRFWMSGCDQADDDDDDGETPVMSMGTEWCYSPLSVSPQGSLMLHPLCPDTCLHPSSNSVYTQESRDINQMLQALRFEPSAGLYFTHFCEKSGNQLWENAVYFWTDLQRYHELFYQDGMDPYRVQREAQVLYFTYLYGSARRTIGLDEKVRGDVYDRLVPAFEELFDKVEEHTLNILLQPWTLLVSRDKESFLKVCVQAEVRRVGGQTPKLQSGFKEPEYQLKQEEQCGSVPFFSPSPSSATKTPSLPESWSGVSPDYQGYRLGSLLRHPHEIGHFMSFLQNQDASVHLTCWLDLEQYRRTPQKDKAARQERSSHITTKYLNRNYFFGPDSPASADQQSDILHLAGGLERLKLDCVSNSVAAEIQDIVRSHIEKTWLPQFLSTPQFEERQKHRLKLRAADRLSQPVHCRRRLRREAWKAKGLWMSSSKEILLFRRILLNPVTCVQFQHFVSLKGDFLENDVLFWLEVQRYKDLCHSHSDEETIQRKISTIISCFVNSSMPPALQIDIPPEQAQHILENRHELGPYVFREAQLSVFSELLRFWPEFQELCSSIQEEQLLPLLEEKRVKHRARVRRQRRKEEEEDERIRTQEELETEEYSFREDDEADDDDDVDNRDDDQEERSQKKHWRTQSRALLSPTQPLSWSYSKYMAALKREEALLRRHSLPESSFSTASESSSICSIKSAGSKHRQSSSGANRALEQTGNRLK
ncbi:regulator of G-protein signaling 22 [Betta splendens]|uniref:Regulator of G-protein signaling 22 n=1 Tax=Betta splendens TaxID=158456 RepID=A0A6P7KN05_BETSP|nr:regulator of G-protein signaling 22 [Betta splendens]